MKVFKKTINLIAFAILSTSFGLSFAFAETTQNKLTANFFTESIKDVAKGFSETISGEKKNVVNATATLPIEKSALEGSILVTPSSTTEVVEEEDKTSCEYYDTTIGNVLDLEAASADTRQKIENVEETIDSETSLRDSILGSVKDLLGLQKKDKVIFREMKKDIADARSYYDNVDFKLSETEVFLDENFCEDIEVKEAKKIDTETQNMVDDEDTYRKQFVSSLKEKMKILQDATKSAKK